MIPWIEAHQFLAGLAVMCVANAAITALPSPDDKSGKFYRWFFNFGHGLVGAFARIAAQYKSDSNGKPAIQ